MLLGMQFITTKNLPVHAEGAAAGKNEKDEVKASEHSFVHALRISDVTKVRGPNSPALRAMLDVDTGSTGQS